MCCFRPRLAKNGKVSAANDHVRQLLMEWFVLDAGAYEAVERMEINLHRGNHLKIIVCKNFFRIFDISFKTTPRSKPET